MSKKLLILLPLVLLLISSCSKEDDDLSQLAKPTLTTPQIQQTQFH